MLLFISSTPSRRKSRPKRTLHLRCDVCDVEYTKPFSTHVEVALYHICSRNCHTLAQRTGGLLDQKKRVTFLTRYGADNPQRIETFHKATRATNIERYGVAVSSQAGVVKERARLTNRERFNVDWHTQSENFFEKSKKTWLHRYGVDHPMRSVVVKRKHDFSCSWKKAHETKKKNGTYSSSNCERKFFERLQKLFPHVETQIHVQHDVGVWLIDFRVGDVYVQLDGSYWHGLDRPIDVIKSSTKPRDGAIVRAFYRDREQDAWFAAQNMRLIRITDKQAKSLTDDALRGLVTS